MVYKISDKKFWSAIFILTIFFLFLGSLSKVEASVSGTSTALTSPFSQNKVKENFNFAALQIELTATAGESLTSITVTIATTTNANPTALTSSSFTEIGVFKDGDANSNFSQGDILLATSTVNIGASSTIDIAAATTTPADGVFFVALNTADVNVFTDNGYPDDPTAIPQKFTVSIASDGVITSTSSPVLNATTTLEFVADTHSQGAEPSNIGSAYQNGNYYLFDANGAGGVGEEGIIFVYASSTGGTPIATSSLTVAGETNINIGSTYQSSVWLSVADVLGHPQSSPRVQYTLPALPQVTSIKAFTDRIIFKTSKNLKGDQAMDCTNYTITGYNPLNCSGPGYPFIDFFGNQVVIRDLDLTAGNQISFSISSIQDNNPEQFPLNYSTTTLLVQQVSIPVISSISPQATTTGSTVVISGSNFGTTAGTVLFSGGFDPQKGPQPPVEASTTAWSDTSITAVVPTGANSGPVQIVTSDGIMSDPNENSFFNVLTDVYLRIDVLSGGSTTTLATSTNMQIFIGSMAGENIYFDGDDNGTTFNTSTYVYKIPNISSMGFTWAYDTSGYYLPAPGRELQSSTSSSSPMVLTLQGTTTRKVSGTITLGTSCTSQGQNRWVAVMALPEGVETEMGPGGIQPSFFKTNSSCTTSYALALPGTATSSIFRIEAHLPPFAVSATTTLMDPAAQLITVSNSNPTATVNFTFTEADRKILGRIVGADGNPLNAQEYQELWVFAFQPVAEGKSTASKPNSQGYFSLYLTEGIYKIGVGGPMMPFPIERDITVDSSSTFDLNSNTVAITIKLKPPTNYIEGYVKDGSGNAIFGVDIFAWCEGAPGGGHAFTDLQGYYKMFVPPCSNYHVGGFAKDYGQLSEQSNITVSSNINPTVNFTLSTANFITVSGSVAKNGESVTNADVWITQQQFGPGLGWSRTDANGNYKITLEKGNSNLYLHAVIPGQGEFYSQLLNSGNSLNSSTTVNISVNTAILEIHLSPGNTFDDVFIGAHSSTAAAFTRTRVATSTSYDTYKLEVPYSDGGTTYIIDGGIPAFGPIETTSTVVSGNQTINIDLNSVEFYTVSGTVTASGTSATSSGAFVWAGGSQGGGGTKVNSDGSFSLKLRAGTYDIGVSKAGYTGSVLLDQTISTTTTGLSLTLTKNDATISGYVKYGSTPISNARVWADNGSGGWSGTVSEADGSFSLSVTSGEWKVGVMAEGYRADPIRVTAPASDIIINVSKVDFSPERKQQSIKPIEGGVIQTDDAKVEVPSGALGSDSTKVAVKIQDTMNVPEGSGVKVLSSKAKEITASYSEGNNEGRSISVLNKNINLEIVLTKAELEAEGISDLNSAKKLKIGYFDETVGNWVEISTAVTVSPSGASWSNLSSITLKGTSDHLSDFAPISPTEGAPSTPTGLTATAGDQQVTLTWNSSSGATKYFIYRKSGSQYPFLASTTQTQTSYTDTGLTNGTTYYYKVSAANDADQESAASDAVSATPTGGGTTISGAISGVGDFTPPSISNIEVTADDISATISWRTSESSISWLVYGTSTDYGFEIKTATSTIYHSIILTGLLPSTTYHYQIKSKDLAGNIGSSNDLTFTTLSQKAEEEISKPITEMTVEELKAEIARLTALVAQLQAKLAQLKGVAVVGVPADFKFEKNLRFGDVSDDVKYLQIVLNSDPDTRLANTGVGSPGYETRYFGPLTKAAVIKFQEKYASEVLVPWNLTKGTGFVGKTTKVKLNQILGK